MATAGQSEAHDHGRAGAGQETPPPIAVRYALERIIRSTAFRHTDRLRRFIRFVVEKTLDGRGDELKEYVVGVEVFERPASFDPRADPVVRVEARRLRFKLRDYYEGEGKDDPFIIDLPKGSYAPAFSTRRPPAAAADGDAEAGGTRRSLWRLAAAIALLVAVAAARGTGCASPRSSSTPQTGTTSGRRPASVTCVIGSRSRMTSRTRSRPRSARAADQSQLRRGPPVVRVRARGARTA